MATIYFLDNENIPVNKAKDYLSEQCKEGDLIYILLGEQQVDTHREKLNKLSTKARIHIHIVSNTDTLNALDFQLVAQFGRLSHQYPNYDYVIISNDNGYKPIKQLANEWGIKCSLNKINTKTGEVQIDQEPTQYRKSTTNPTHIIDLQKQLLNAKDNYQSQNGKLQRLMMRKNRLNQHLKLVNDDIKESTSYIAFLESQNSTTAPQKIIDQQKKHLVLVTDKYKYDKQKKTCLASIRTKREILHSISNTILELSQTLEAYDTEDLSLFSQIETSQLLGIDRQIDNQVKLLPKTPNKTVSKTTKTKVNKVSNKKKIQTPESDALNIKFKGITPVQFETFNKTVKTIKDGSMDKLQYKAIPQLSSKDITNELLLELQEILFNIQLVTGKPVTNQIYKNIISQGTIALKSKTMLTKASLTKLRDKLFNKTSITVFELKQLGVAEPQLPFAYVILYITCCRLIGLTK